MKIEIESDVFDIVDRIKEIDEGYKILYDTKSGKLELHNINQINTFCLNIKNNEILPVLINDILCSQSRFIDNIIDKIDRNNRDIEKNNRDNIKDITDYMAREVFDFSNNSSKEYNCNNAFCNKWR